MKQNEQQAAVILLADTKIVTNSSEKETRGARNKSYKNDAATGYYHSY